MTRSNVAQTVVRSVPLSCHVYTPADLADAIVGAIGDAPDLRWLEPSVGGGALVAALNRAGIPRARIRGLDLVRVPTPRDALARVLRGTDFLAWSRRTTEVFDRIVANPPYARLVRCSKGLRKEVLALRRFTALPIPLTANLWYPFVLAGLRRLAPSGRVAFILPASFEYGDYSAPLRRALPKMFDRVTIIRSMSSLFEEPPVDGGVIILIGVGFRGENATGPSRPMDIQEVQDRNEVIKALVDRRAPTAQRGQVARNLVGDRKKGAAETLFGHIAQIRIGAVTGDSSFFVMSENRRVMLGLPRSAFVKVVSKRQHLVTGHVGTESWEELRRAGEAVLLFRPAAKLLEHAAVRKYLHLPEAEGGCHKQAYKVRARPCWHSVQLPQSVHAFVSSAVNGAPHVALASGGILATNSLLVVEFVKELAVDQRDAILLSLYLHAATAVMERRIRRYAGGLLKCEPSDFAALPVTVPEGTCNGARQMLKRVMLAVSLGNVSEARRLAADWFDRLCG
jgi:adenine-specific DNA-methyltransferase